MNPPNRTRVTAVIGRGKFAEGSAGWAILLRVILPVCLGLAFCGFQQVKAQFVPSARERILFDRDWRFQTGDDTGAERAGFDDSKWRQLNLPHDWMIEGVKGGKPEDMEGPFDKGSPAGAGGAYMDGGIGCYRKTFVLPDADQGKEITLLFDGAYMGADVWLNGQHLGWHPYGFTSFYYDITRALKFDGQKNVLAVKLNVRQPCCRWYSGAGLYRDAWLIETAPVHVGVWGTYVTTPQVSKDRAQVRVRTTVSNDGAMPEGLKLISIIMDPNGNEVARASEARAIAAKAKEDFDLNIPATHPRLWSLESPALYKLVTQVWSGDKLVDSVETPFGIRTIEFTRDNGFLLNGRRVQIQGVCDHHDLGALGAAAYPRAIQRKLEILKSMGCNAIRTSHNPPSPVLLDLCDRMGFLVMDEAFDEWSRSKVSFGYGGLFDKYSEPDLVSMLDRDRNHPSIVLWSIGNEITEGTVGDSVAGPLAQRLAAICHREDPTRPVTTACPNPVNAWKSGMAKALDVFGINYAPGFFAANSPESREHPSADPNQYSGQLPMIASETQSEVDTRGEYGLSLDAKGSIKVDMQPDHQVSAYDGFEFSCWPGGINNPDNTFLALDHAPWVAGEFVWTGFDYLGEPSPYTWPSRSSYFGIVDMCGFPKDRYYQFKAHWTNEPVVHVLPHWTWPGFEGKAIPIKVFTNADTVELFLNGKSVGAKKFPADCERTPKPSLHLVWSVPYEPGELRAVARKNGKVVAIDTVKTAGPPARIAAVADRTRIDAGDRDLSFIKVSILDKDGNVCPNAEPELQFSVSGDAGAIAGLDNGDPTNHEAFQGAQHKAFHGLALAILKSRGDATGAVTLTVSGAGIEPATVTIQVMPARNKLADRVM